MPTTNIQIEQAIQEAMRKSAGEAANIINQIWQPLASQLISIIGEGGFNSLYTRSLYLSHVTFPWLAFGGTSYDSEVQFTQLRINLEGRDAIEANKANHMLLQTFTNILASLIGEPLTINILSSAWGDKASDAHNAGKEFPHE